MKISKLNRVLHRDLGYFFVGLTIIYALSGLMLNHIDDFDFAYNIETRQVSFDLPDSVELVSDDAVKAQLAKIDEKRNYLMFDSPDEGLIKIYLKNGSIFYNLEKKQGELEKVTKRPVLFDLNRMHRNPGILWTIFTDIYIICLLFISIGGLFILKGRNGISGRGKWFIVGGIATSIGIYLIYI